MNFKKILNPWKINIKGRYIDVFLKVEFADGCLTISGVEGPLKTGNCLGSCRQIEYWTKLSNIKGKDLSLKECIKLLNIWREWHLNNMQAGCEHQRELLKCIKDRSYDHLMKIPEFKKCSKCDYAYGSAWLKKEVPTNVLEWLKNLPGYKQHYKNLSLVVVKDSEIESRGGGYKYLIQTDGATSRTAFKQLKFLKKYLKDRNLTLTQALPKDPEEWQYQKIEGEYFTLSYMSEKLPAGRAIKYLENGIYTKATITKDEHGIICLNYCNVNVKNRVKYKYFWA